MFIAKNIATHSNASKRDSNFIFSILINKQTKMQLELLLKKRRRATSSSTAKSCSDFSYEQEESCGELQMSNSSQFHLSNLLLLTLAEKATRDKQLMPLW